MRTKQTTRLLVLLILLGIFCLISSGVLGWIWYDGHVDRSGWEMQHGQYYYRDFHNHRVTGWQEIDGSRYYFAEDNTGMQTGWLTLGDDRYYLDTDGTLVTGWLSLDGANYYLDGDGLLQTGLLSLDGQLYLLDDTGRMLTGLQLAQGNAYYFTPEGPAARGPVTLGEHSFFFGEDGTQQTGWIQLDGKTFYYLPEGPMALGLQEIDGKTYYFGEDGAAAEGWVTLGEYSYYFGPDKAALTGPQQIDGRTHYFTPKGIHVILVNASNPIPDYYDPDPAVLFDWHQMSAICVEPMRKMLADCEAAGNPYTFNSAYRSHENQELIVEKRTQENMALGLTYEEAYEKTLETAAYPGTSEHEMGLAADIVGKEANAWLAQHCWEYGFILRYPPDKHDITGIVYEPWHFRYVGTQVSMDMKDSGLCLEEYLGAGPAVKK